MWPPNSCVQPVPIPGKDQVPDTDAECKAASKGESCHGLQCNHSKYWNCSNDLPEIIQSRTLLSPRTQDNLSYYSQDSRLSGNLTGMFGLGGRQQHFRE